MPTLASSGVNKNDQSAAEYSMGEYKDSTRFHASTSVPSKQLYTVVCGYVIVPCLPIHIYVRIYYVLLDFCTGLSYTYTIHTRAYYDGLT